MFVHNNKIYDNLDYPFIKQHKWKQDYFKRNKCIT